MTTYKTTRSRRRSYEDKERDSKESERVVQVKKYDTLVEVIKNCNIKNCHGWIGVEKLTGEPKLTEIKNLIDENRPIAVSREEFMIWMLLALDELNCFKEYGKNFVDQELKGA